MQARRYEGACVTSRPARPSPPTSLTHDLCRRRSLGTCPPPHGPAPYPRGPPPCRIKSTSRITEGHGRAADVEGRGAWDRWHQGSEGGRWGARIHWH